MVAAGVVLHAQLPARHELVARVLQYASPRRLALFLVLRSARFCVPQPADISSRFLAAGSGVLLLRLLRGLHMNSTLGFPIGPDMC